MLQNYVLMSGSCDHMVQGFCDLFLYHKAWLSCVESFHHFIAGICEELQFSRLSIFLSEVNTLVTEVGLFFDWILLGHTWSSKFLFTLLMCKQELYYDSWHVMTFVKFFVNFFVEIIYYHCLVSYFIWNHVSSVHICLLLHS